MRRLGCVSYNEALLLQQQFVKARHAGEVPDLLLLLQHPHVLTIGAGARHSHGNIVADSTTLQAKGIQVVEVGRGGDVTYHGPGQLVGYPIVDLRPDRCDVRRYMRDLEEVMIRTAGTFGVTAERVSGLTGVWVGNAKLGAIGVRISKWITSHGFAFNVMTDLEYFNLIVPCGIKDRPATSLSALLGRMVSVTEVEQVLTEHFSVVFDRSVI
ncbi:MAG TPA: lipoyl(octanoyl) transferase [Acidobacteria bacterium]|nr:lipoyl(octanoyl) transferase [Acidobacteriota bacterium]